MKTVFWDKSKNADEPKIEVVTRAGFGGCEFGIDGHCAAHGTWISEHDAVVTTETMTLTEAKRRYPETDPSVWEKLEKR